MKYAFKIVHWKWKIIFVYKYKRNKAVYCLIGLPCVLVVWHTQVIFSKIYIFVITYLRHQQHLYCSILICPLSIKHFVENLYSICWSRQKRCEDFSCSLSLSFVCVTRLERRGSPLNRKRLTTIKGVVKRQTTKPMS